MKLLHAIFYFFILSFSNLTFAVHAEGEIIEWNSSNRTYGWYKTEDAPQSYYDVVSTCGTDSDPFSYRIMCTFTDWGDEGWEPLVSVYKCARQNIETEPFTYFKFLGYYENNSKCRGVVENICSPGAGNPATNPEMKNGSMCSGACEVTEDPVSDWVFTGGPAACQTEDQGSSSSHASSDSNSSDDDGNGGSSSSDDSENNGSSSSSADSDCGFDKDCDGDIDSDDYDYIDENGCYISSDTTPYCPTNSGCSNSFTIEGVEYCADNNGDGEGDPDSGSSSSSSSEGEGDGSSSSDGSGEGEGDCDPETEVCDDNVSGGNDCEDPPVCESNNPVFCELIRQQYFQRCPKTELDEIDPDAKYDSDDSHTLDINTRVEDAKEDYSTRLDNILVDASSVIDLNVAAAGGDSMECQTYTLFGKQVELGMCRISEFFVLIGYAVIAAAALISFSILFTRPS